MLDSYVYIVCTSAASSAFETFPVISSLKCVGTNGKRVGCVTHTSSNMNVVPGTMYDAWWHEGCNVWKLWRSICLRWSAHFGVQEVQNERAAKPRSGRAME